LRRCSRQRGSSAQLRDRAYDGGGGLPVDVGESVGVDDGDGDGDGDELGEADGDELGDADALGFLVTGAGCGLRDVELALGYTGRIIVFARFLWTRSEFAGCGVGTWLEADAEGDGLDPRTSLIACEIAGGGSRMVTRMAPAVAGASRSAPSRADVRTSFRAGGGGGSDGVKPSGPNSPRLGPSDSR
jgi:hypothetical protein